MNSPACTQTEISGWYLTLFCLPRLPIGDSAIRGGASSTRLGWRRSRYIARHRYPDAHGFQEFADVNALVAHRSSHRWASTDSKKFFLPWLHGTHIAQRFSSTVLLPLFERRPMVNYEFDIVLAMVLPHMPQRPCAACSAYARSFWVVPASNGCSFGPL